MLCSFDELRRKEVIDIKTGERLGYIDDIELSVSDGRAEKLVIYGGLRIFGLLGRNEDVIIRSSDIKVVGREVILIERPDVTVKTELTKKAGNSS